MIRWAGTSLCPPVNVVRHALAKPPRRGTCTATSQGNVFWDSARTTRKVGQVLLAKNFIGVFRVFRGSDRNWLLTRVRKACTLPA